MAFMQCLAIRTSDPRSVCWAGGNLEGEVTLVLTDPTLIRGIRLSYRCEAHVDYLDDGQELEIENSDDDVDDDDDNNDNRGGGERGGHKKRQKKKKKKKQKGCMESGGVIPKRRMATEKFLETTSILWGTDPTTSYGEVMPAGHHALAFDIQVPKALPASFEGRYGFVRHWLECVVDRPSAPEMSTKRALSVIAHSDLNEDSVAAKTVHHREEVILCCGCVRPDRYDVSYELPYRGYVPGETMFPDIRLRNFTRNAIHVSARIQMITTYKAKTRRKMTTKVVAEETKHVHKAEVTKWEPRLLIPALPPTGLGGCHVIDVRFIFEVELTSRGFGWQGLGFQDELKIGTIPLHSVSKLRVGPGAPAAAKPPAHSAGVLLGPAYSATPGASPAHRAYSSSTGDGKFASDADSAAPLARLATGGGGGGAGQWGRRNQRSASIISATSHWSFQPAMSQVQRPVHRGFHWKLPARGKDKQQKIQNPKLPTVYRC